MQKQSTVLFLQNNALTETRQAMAHTTATVDPTQNGVLASELDTNATRLSAWVDTNIQDVRTMVHGSTTYQLVKVIKLRFIKFYFLLASSTHLLCCYSYLVIICCVFKTSCKRLIKLTFHFSIASRKQDFWMSTKTGAVVFLFKDWSCNAL